MSPGRAVYNLQNTVKVERTLGERCTVRAQGWSLPWCYTEGRTSTPHKDSVCTPAGIYLYTAIRVL